MPTLSLVGVPVITPVAESIVAQLEPSNEYVAVSVVSTSLKLTEASYEYAASSSVEAAVIAVVTVGASLVPVTVTTIACSTVPPLPSLTITVNVSSLLSSVL